MDSGGYGDPQQAADNTGRIPKSVANGTVIFLYVLALLSAFLRTVIRLRHRRLQWLDDGFLLAAVVLMTIALGLYFSFIDDVYVAELFIYNTFAAGPLLVQAVSIGERVQTYTIPYIILSLSGIFAVKFSFLFFFRNILSRIRPLVLFWRVVVAYTAVVWAFSVGFSVYGCPYVDERALSCAQGPELWRAIDASVGLIVCDVTSDILIVAIPIFVLRQIRLPWRKKIYLAASLCLSLVMVAVAILQAATLTYAGVAAIDVVWQIYFQFVELTIAVIVVSSTAFRAFFVQRTEGSDSTPKSPGWYNYKNYKKVFQKLWSSSAESEPPRIDQSIPRAEMTGVRGYIDRAAGSPWPDSGSERGQEMRLMRPPKARREPAAFVGSMLSPEEEYHRIQRNILRNSPTSEISALDVGDGSSGQAITPVSEAASHEAGPEDGRPSPVSPEHGRRSRIGISRQGGDKMVGHGNTPTPEPRVSPIEGSDYQVDSAGPSWKPSADPSAQTSRRPSQPSTSAEIGRPLPPTPPREEGSRMDRFYDDSRRSLEPSEALASAAGVRRPSRTLRPPGDEPLRESGLKRAIKDSFDMASGTGPQDSESWFYDK